MFGAGSPRRIVTKIFLLEPTDGQSECSHRSLSSLPTQLEARDGDQTYQAQMPALLNHFSYTSPLWQPFPPRFDTSLHDLGAQ